MKTNKPLLAILLSLTSGPLIEGYSMLMKYLGLTNLTALEALSFVSSKEPHHALGIIGIFIVVFWISILTYYSVYFGVLHFFQLRVCYWQ